MFATIVILKSVMSVMRVIGSCGFAMIIWKLHKFVKVIIILKRVMSVMTGMSVVCVIRSI